MTTPTPNPFLADRATPDALERSWVRHLPARLRPYARLARFDRPIGTWLLYWPCVWGVALAGAAWREVYLLVLFFIGAIAMRGAGCVYNDIVDRDLDARVARTRDRPVASGRVSVRAAWILLLLLSGVGLLVLVQLQALAQAVALGSLLLVAGYPFMKRITWWPQAWLGLTFNWGALVGWAAAAETLTAPALWLYAGGIAWTLGYDTIYALQDMEDDALVGVRSSARRLGGNVRTGVGIFYALALAAFTAALYSAAPEHPWRLLALLPLAAHFVWQVRTLAAHDEQRALKLFRANTVAGLLLAAACVLMTL